MYTEFDRPLAHKVFLLLSEKKIQNVFSYRNKIPTFRFFWIRYLQSIDKIDLALQCSLKYDYKDAAIKKKSFLELWLYV